MKNKLLRVKLVVILWCIGSALVAQNLAGVWKGSLSQQGSSAQYTYEMHITQDGAAISGIAISMAPTGDSARFNLTGIWDDGQLILQELQQLEPETPRWCLKYVELKLTQEANQYILSGNWKADACEPGRIQVRKTKQTQQEVITETVPFRINGRWTGHLSQVDREYGFYYELDLAEGGTGISYIVSEDNGGSANHALRWVYDQSSALISIKESEIVNRTDPQWPWCIKSANFRMRKADQRYIIEGSWEGYIEGWEGIQKGKCASGTLYLEKPILTRQTVATVEEAYHKSEKSSLRTVKVGRVLEVQNERLQIQVWDNGTVDGDAVTLFLNGERLLYNYRVSKRKMTVPVQLKQDNNFLILHAEDIGSISPNTVAVSVNDGVKEQVIIMSSNLNFSGAVMIKRFRRK